MRIYLKIYLFVNFNSCMNLTLPMIKIISPKIVIALGKQTFSALFDGCEDKREPSKSSFQYINTKIFHQPHPAARISNFEKEEMWGEMKKYLSDVT